MVLKSGCLSQSSQAFKKIQISDSHPESLVLKIWDRAQEFPSVLQVIAGATDLHIGIWKLPV